MLWCLTYRVVELEGCTKANEVLHELREAVESREAATEDKLRLERLAREDMVLEPLCFLLGETHRELS